VKKKGSTVHISQLMHHGAFDSCSFTSNMFDIPLPREFISLLGFLSRVLVSCC